MEKINVLVTSLKNSSGMVCLAATKDVELNENITLKKGFAFCSVSPEIYDAMKKPKSVEVTPSEFDGFYFEPNLK
jgi:hypothetical protein